MLANRPPMLTCNCGVQLYPHYSEMRVEYVFKQGPLPTQTLTISQGRGRSTRNVIPFPPKPLMLAVPSVSGDYPLLLFLHGYLDLNNFYTQLLQHIASHGYITIAPQMQTILGGIGGAIRGGDATREIADAVAITEWLPAGLCQHLPEKVLPDFRKLAIAGHSRGGKVAFGAALGRNLLLPSSPYAALLGIDPVDGMDAGKQTHPPILTYRDRSFALNVPTLVIGSGLGPVKRNLFSPPCAPAGVNHVDFFRECCAPAYHFVAVDYGHMDFLDDKTDEGREMFSQWLCKNGAAREPMRRFGGGIMVAFLNAWLRKEAHVLNELVANPSLAPVKVEPPKCYVL